MLVKCVFDRFKKYKFANKAGNNADQLLLLFYYTALLSKNPLKEDRVYILQN